MFNYNLFAILFIWVANFIFLISLIPQIFLNKKIKSTKGLSDLFILGNLNSAACNLGYAFFIGLPFVYKFFNPLYFILILIILIQRFYYTDVLKNKKFIFYFFINLILIFLMTYNIFYKNNLDGYFLGWIPVFISLSKKMPQIFKVYNSKSVEGFSVGFIVICLIGHLFEICGVFILDLPKAVLFQNLKGLFIYSIFLYQFLFYSKFNKRNVIYRFR